MSFDSISQSRIGWRVTCLESPENLTINILTPKGLPSLAFSLLFLGGWGFIFFGQLQFGVDPNFACVGVVIALFPLYVLLWSLMGKEIITINREKIVVRQTIFGIGFRQTYQLLQVNNLRRSLTDPALFTLERNLQDWGFAGGSVAFDYTGRVCRFGLLLTKEDADTLVAKISQYLAISAKSFSKSTVKA